MIMLSKGKAKDILIVLLSLLLLSVLLTVFSSPSSSSSFSSPASSFGYDQPSAFPEMGMMKKMAGGARNMMMESSDASISYSPSSGPFIGDISSVPQGRMVARTANIEIQVEQPEESGKKFEEFILEKKGFVTSFSDSGDSAFVNARIPAESLDEAIEFARKLAKVVVRVYKEGNDVTEEFVDQNARLKNAVAARDRLLELMEKAKEVQDILQIERELNQLTERIESFKARSDYLLQTTSLSSITLSLFKPYEPTPTIPEVNLVNYLPIIPLALALLALLVYVGKECWASHARKGSS